MPRTLSVIALALIAGSLTIAPATAGDVNVGVNIGVPAPPPIVLAAPPPVVVVPDSRVYYAPNVSFNLFLYGGRYYSFHEGAWFVASKHSGPFVYIKLDKVPHQVRAVPVTYYKVPPGQAKKAAKASGGQASPASGGCPPGHAKQGRC